MATIRFFSEAHNRYYNVIVDLDASVVSNDVPEGVDYYLKISTTLRDADGSSLGLFIVRDLTDVPSTYGPVADFTELVEAYIDYFVDMSKLIESSSSSSSSSSSNSSSSSSSTEEMTTSSNSSNSSNSSSSVV